MRYVVAVYIRGRVLICAIEPSRLSFMPEDGIFNEHIQVTLRDVGPMNVRPIVRD